MGFIHLHVHSEYSLLEGACRIGELVGKAKSLGFDALALTDKAVMYGVIPFYKACRRHGIKPIIGMEIYVETEHGRDIRKRHHRKPPSIVLLAKSHTGYRNLMKLSSLAQTGRPGLYPCVTREQLAACAEDIIAMSSGINGDVEHHLRHGNKDQAKRTAALYKQIYGDDYYLEIQDHDVAEEKELNLDVIALSRETGIPLVASNDVHYLEKNDALSHDCLLCIKNGDKLADEEREKLPSHEYDLKPAEAMEERFAHLTEAVANTGRIASECNVTIDLGRPMLPAFPVPEGETASRYLRRLCEEGLQARFNTVTETARKRLDRELAIIEDMGFSDYFLIVWDFMTFARNRDILTGPGRGSAAGSLVAYALGITDVDPLAHGLLFERFLNPERVTMPDIDIDFPDTRRDEVIRYVADQYGREHVAQIVTFGTLAARAAVRDVGRVLDTDPKTVDSVAKNIPSRPGITLDEAVEESAALKKQLRTSKEARNLFEIARTIEGFPRHTSTHAAGIVISKEKLTDIVPVQEGQDGLVLTQYPMDVLEDIGLLKMDFLGLRNLSLIENIVQLIRKGTGRSVNVKAIPFDDRKTFELLARGDTTGVFQLESEGMRDVLRKLEPSHFEDIAAVNALYRPGPMDHIPTYIAGKHGRRKVTYLHDDLKPILKHTYGVIVYQEQIMQIAAKMAGFSFGEADLLRRAVSKKKKRLLDEEREHFVNGCTDNGYDRKTADAIYDLIVRFADYGFNRSHAVAYSVIAYQLAYLKAHYLKFFMAELLSSVLGDPRKLDDYIRELKVKRVPLYPPSVNKSGSAFTPEGDGIRFGLLAVKNLGVQAVRAIIDNRPADRYTDLFDLCARVPMKTVSRRALESLILAGGMDDFGIDRARLVTSLQAAIDYGERVQEKIKDGQMGWFGADGEAKPDYEQAPPFDRHETLKLEKQALGFYLSGHPLDMYDDVLETVHRQMIDDVRSLSDKKITRVAGLVTTARYTRTKKGDQMAFLTLSDESGDVDLIVFPKLYQSHPLYFEKERLLLVEGRVQKEEGAVKIIAEKAMPLNEVQFKRKESDKQTLYLKIDRHHRRTETMTEVKKLLQRYQGNVDVILFYEAERKSVRLAESLRVSPSSECLRHLRKRLGEHNVVLKK